MASIKQQLYRGTQVVKAFSNINRSGGVVMCNVTGVSGSTLGEIAAYAKSQVNGTAIFEAGVDVLDARVYRYVDDKAFAVVRFGRDSSSYPALAGTVNVTESVGYEYDDYNVGTTTSVYNPVGGGTVYGTHYFYYSGPAPIGRLHMHTVLTTHPGTSIDALVGKTNNAAFVMGSRSHPANTLRFDGATIQPIPTRTGTAEEVVARFAVTYNYARRSAGAGGTVGWVRYVFSRALSAGTVAIENPWLGSPALPSYYYVNSITYRDRYDRATFSFPLHA